MQIKDLYQQLNSEDPTIDKDLIKEDIKTLVSNFKQFINDQEAAFQNLVNDDLDTLEQVITTNRDGLNSFNQNTGNEWSIITAFEAKNLQDSFDAQI